MSLFRRFLLFGAAAVVGILAAGCSDQSPAVAYVNGSEISQQDYLSQLEMTRSAQGTPAGVSTLNSMVESLILVQEAKKEGVAPTADEVHAELTELNQEPSFQEQMRRMSVEPDQVVHLLIEPRMSLFRIYAKMAGVTDADLKSFFERHKAEFRRPEQVSARILQVSDRKQAEEAMKLVGKMSFETIVQNFGHAAGAAPDPNAGSIVTLSRQTLGNPYPPAVVNAAFATPKGKTTGIIEGTPQPNFMQPQQPPATKQYYIVEVEDHTPAQEPSLSNMLIKDQVYQAAAQEKAGTRLSPSAIPDLIASLRRSASIQVVRPSVKSVEAGPPATPITPGGPAAGAP